MEVTGLTILSANRVSSGYEVQIDFESYGGFALETTISFDNDWSYSLDSFLKSMITEDVDLNFIDEVFASDGFKQEVADFIQNSTFS